MDWFVNVMLVIQAGLVLTMIYGLGFERPTARRPGPRYLSIGFSLLLSAIVSWEISAAHRQAGGAALLRMGAPLLLGMGIVLLLLALRQRRGLDGPMGG
jgi:hypothetical protein